MLKTNIDDLNAQNSQLQAKLTDLKLRNNELQTINNDLQTKNQDLNQEIQRVYSGHAGLENEINFLKYRITTLDQLHDNVVVRAWKNDHKRANYYCAYPFDRIEILPRGEVYTCCSAYLKHNFYLGNIFEQEFSEIWNSEKALKLRYSVSHGNFEYCNDSCIFFNSRDKGEYPLLPRKSKPKLGETNSTNQSIEQNPYGSSSDYEVLLESCRLKRGPRQITLSCDESCNLHCKSCRSEIKMIGSALNAKLTDVLMHKLRPLLKDCTSLRMLGSGEVFVSKSCMELLKSITHEEFPNLKIELLSNGQLFTPKMLEKLSNLRGVPLEMSFSIDGATKATYEALRNGASFEKLLENIKYASQLKSDGFITLLGIHFVIQKSNFLELPALLKMANELNFDFMRILGLSNWGTFKESDFIDLNILDRRNPEHEEALALLKQVLRDEKYINIYQNVIAKD